MCVGMRHTTNARGWGVIDIDGLTAAEIMAAEEAEAAAYAAEVDGEEAEAEFSRAPGRVADPIDVEDLPF